ncbi:hypothetical protein Tco_0071725 [Tanacetum coccineum]
MAGLDFCSKHNMVAYLEKTDRNTEFHQIMDFLIRSSIHFALTVSPIVSTSFIEQFWTSAKSRIVNNISYIDVIVAGKLVTISDASIRRDLLFDDLKDVPVPMDHFPVPALTKKVLTFMVKKGKNFLGNVTPLFDYMLVQPTEDEGEVSERPSEPQPIPSPTHPSEDQPEPQPDPSPRPSPSIPISDSNPEGSGGNHGVTAQAVEIKILKAQLKQLTKKARPVINHHKAWFRAARLKKQHKQKDMEKSNKRRSDAMDTDLEDYTLTQDEGTDKQTTDLQKSIDVQQSTDKQNEGTDRTKVSTDSFVEGTAEIKDQVSGESDAPTVPTMTSTPTPTVFGNDETIAQVLVTMSQNKLKQKEKEKGVELKDVEDIKRPRPTSTRSLLTLKHLPKIDPKAKGKGKIEEEDESDTESEDINEAEKKFKMLANDEEMARKYDFIQARLNADKILAEKLQEEEREKFTIEERAKFLHDTIAAQRRFLAQQRSEIIRNKLPSRTQLRNQMMTYLKHVGGKKHSDLKTKNFEEIQVLYEKLKRSDENFIAIGSVENERLIKDLNKKAASIKKDDSIKEETKEEEVSDKDKEVDYEILNKKYPIIEWKSEYLGIKPQFDKTKDLEEIDLNVVIRSNGQKRYFSTLMRVLSIFDRDDLNVVYQLVMDKYQDEIPKGVHNLMTEAGLVIHMLVEKKYPLRKKVLLQMLKLKLESEEDNTMALELIRFIKKLIAELEPKDSDGYEEDL